MNYQILTKLLILQVMLGLFALQNIATAQNSPPVTNDLEMHLSADSLQLSEGDNVGQWEDLTGNGNHAELVASTLPEYVADGIAGKPTVQFDGSDDYLKLNDDMIDLNNATVFIVGQFTDLEGEPYMIGAQEGNELEGDRLRITQYSWHNNWVYAVGNGHVTNSGTAADTEPHVFSLSSEMEAYLDGELDGAETNDGAADTTSGLSLGAREGGASNYFSGNISEVVIYNRQLTESEIADVNDHLMHKYDMGGQDVALIEDGLAMHLSAEELDLSDGDKVEQWNDISGNENHAESGDVTSFEPSYVEDGIAGQPTVQFDGSDDFLQLNDEMISLDSATVFIAGQFTDLNPGHNPYMIGANLEGSDDRLRITKFGWSNKWIYQAGSVGANWDAGNTIMEADTEPHVFGITSEMTAYLDNQDITLGDADTENTSDLNPNGLSLGAREDGGAGHFEGNISEVFVYSRQLTESEIADVNGYLMRKYGMGEQKIQFANLQSPESMDLASKESDTAYAQVQAVGTFGDTLTAGTGASDDVTAWFGIHDEDTDPAEWPEDAWQQAEFHESKGDRDEYMLDLSMAEPGTYYYASRFQVYDDEMAYGGFNANDDGGFWDGEQFVSGEMTVTPIEVEDVASVIDNGEMDGTVYELTGEAIVTYVAPDFRNQHYLSDTTGAVVIDDPDEVISGLERGDGITGLSFTFGEHQGTYQISPLADVEASSSDNELPYWETTLADLEYVGEPRMMKVKNVQFLDEGDFEASTNYDIIDPTVEDPVTFRTHLSGSDVIGEPIPDDYRDVTAIASEYEGEPQLYAAHYDLLQEAADPPLLQVTFNVDMSNAGDFDAGNHDVYISGTFADSEEPEEAVNEWVQPGMDTNYRLEAQEDDQDTYTLTLGVEEGEHTYKYYLVEDEPTWDLGEWDGEPNREISVEGDMELNDNFGNQDDETVVSVEDEMAELPDEIGLKQNYPNPFNPATTIEYQLPQATYVELSVYNMLGREVATLVNKQVEAGFHQVSFDGSDLSSGLYLYRLQAGDKVITNKMSLVK